MKKTDAINLFGTRLSDLGNALNNRGRSAICRWPENLDDDQINMVIGAAVRRGIKIPRQLLDSIKITKRKK